MFYPYIKRVFDIIAGIFGTTLLIPITILLKLAYILAGDFNSIFYSQKRVGKNGREFNMLKYRSMIPDADHALEKLLKDEKYCKQWDKFQKLDDDPRITKVGKFIRKSSLDEFPQFINVLLGQMSLVGPRPLIPGELKKHTDKNKDIKKYQSVKPGVTGYWAMRIRSDNSSDYDERLKLEFFYIDNRSLALDAKISFHTIEAVISHRGAK